MSDKDGTTPDKAICLHSDDDDVMSQNDNNNKDKEEEVDVLNEDDVSSVYNNDDVMSKNDNNKNDKEEEVDVLNEDEVSSVYNSGTELRSDHSSSDDCRTTPNEFYDEESLSSSVSGHSSDTPEPRWTGPSRMTAHKTPTSRKYLKRKEKTRCVKSGAHKFRKNNWRLAKRAKRQKKRDERVGYYDIVL
jgi:hypothetical protein